MSVNSVEKKVFATETKQILELFAKWLYRDKEIFLRELISNASDANDKLKVLALQDESLYGDDADLKIWVLFDKEKKTVTIKDNGIGMDYDEVVSHLGTIARSGTKQFLKKMSETPAKGDSAGNLIGQFGVGFYSAFVVANEVEVRTRRANVSSDQGVVWKSDGVEEYSISKEDIADRGTQIIIHLKDDAVEFLEMWRLRKVITRYSDHIAYPITMYVEVEKKDEEGKESENKDKEPEKEIKEEVVNQAKAMWTLSKKDIEDKEYEDFYKHIGHDFNNPLAWAHNKVEGKLEYTTLLYIPSQAPFDLWNRDTKRGLKLYVQRVFILDDAEHLLPGYLRFVKGLVDSNDLPLNVSREVLQSGQIVETIKASCTKRVLDLLEYMANEETEKYQKFWDAFGVVLKEGPGEDFANKDKIAKLLRFSSTESTKKQDVSLDSYIERMKEGQDKIYYVSADSPLAAANSPHLELFRKRGIEVLLFSDRVDEWMVSRLDEYQGKKIVSITRGDVDLGDAGLDEKEKEAYDKAKKEYEGVVKQVKDALDGKVKDVKITERLTDSPSCIVADENEMSSNLKRMMKEAGQAMPETLPILELNPDHHLVERLKQEASDDKFKKLANILLSQAILSEGGALENPSAYVKDVNELLLQS